MQFDSRLVLLPEPEKMTRKHFYGDPAMVRGNRWVPARLLQELIGCA